MARASGTSSTSLRLFLVIGGVTVISPASMDIYLPGLPQLSRALGVGPSAGQLTVTTFLIGLAFGQLLAGSLSDVHGRRRPLIAGMAAFIAVSFASALAPNLFSLCLMRLLQGTAASAGMAIGRAIVRDLYAGAAAARYLSRLMLIVGLGPILAPFAGGELLRITSWRGVFVAVAALGSVLLIMTVRLLPETHPVNVRHAGGLHETVASIRLLLGDHAFIGWALVVGFGGGAINGYVAGSSFVLENVYGASPQLYGLLFAGNAVCMVAGAQMNAHLVDRLPPTRLLSAGLTTMVVAGTALLAVLPLRGAGLMGVVPPLMLLMFSWSLVQPNALALALTRHPGLAGTAAAMMGVSQFLVGAAVAPLTGIGGSMSRFPMAIVISVCGIAAAVASITLGQASRGGQAAAPAEM